MRAHLADSYRSSDLLPPLHRLPPQYIRQRKAPTSKHPNARLPPPFSRHSTPPKTPCKGYYPTSYENEGTTKKGCVDKVSHRVPDGEDVGEGGEAREEGDEGEDGEDGDGGEDGRVG